MKVKIKEVVRQPKKVVKFTLSEEQAHLLMALLNTSHQIPADSYDEGIASRTDIENKLSTPLWNKLTDILS